MTAPDLPAPRRRVHPRAVALWVCALVWAVCSVAVVVLVQAAEVAETRTSTEIGYPGPSEDEVKMWLALPLYLGAGAFAAGAWLVARGTADRRAEAPAPR